MRFPFYTYEIRYTDGLPLIFLSIINLYSHICEKMKHTNTQKQSRNSK
jgi:hypothetical protein